MSNFIPNETKRFVPCDPWIAKPLKTMLNRKNRLFNNYKKMIIKLRIKLGSKLFRTELSHLMNLGNKANIPNTSHKSFWKIINRVMNQCKAPKIPPLLVNNLFILNYREKARYFNDFFCGAENSSSLTSILWWRHRWQPSWIGWLITKGWRMFAQLIK